MRSGAGLCEVVLPRGPTTETREQCADAIGQCIVMEFGHAEESFGKLGDPAAQDGQAEFLPKPDGREVSGGQRERDQILEPIAIPAPGYLPDGSSV